MNTLIIIKALILVALSAKFVRSDDVGGDITIHDPGFPDIHIEDSDPIATKDNADDDIDIKDSRAATPIAPAPITPAPIKPTPITPAAKDPVIIKDKDEDIFDRNIGSFPDGWHTYQGGNQLRGIEHPAKIEKFEDDGSIPAKIEEKAKDKKTKAAPKKIRKESGMPIGAIAVMVTAGCVLVVGVAVAITIRK